jgi:acyl-CoA-dependent ceramide synthase
MLRYLSFTSACDITFVLFLLSWLVSRQIGLGLVIRSTYLDSRRYIPITWDPARGLYFSTPVMWGFLTMLGILLCLATVWFYMACMVAVRVVRGLGAEDTRSDGGDEGTSEGLEEVADVHEDKGAGLGQSSQGGELRRRK